MHEIGVEEKIGHQLVQVEVAGHEKMEATDIFQVDSP
jgi:hypothetical protein